jgi:hypothetical protein
MRGRAAQARTLTAWTRVRARFYSYPQVPLRRMVGYSTDLRTSSTTTDLQRRPLRRPSLSSL